MLALVAQKIQAFKVRELKKPSVLCSEYEGWLNIWNWEQLWPKSQQIYFSEKEQAGNKITKLPNDKANGEPGNNASPIKIIHFSKSTNSKENGFEIETKKERKRKSSKIVIWDDSDAPENSEQKNYQLKKNQKLLDVSSNGHDL